MVTFRPILTDIYSVPPTDQIQMLPNTGFVEKNVILILHIFKFSNQPSNITIGADFKVIVDSIDKFNAFNIVF